MAKNNRGKNNNPDGRNQYSGWMDTARDRPFTAALTTAAAVGTGVFLWSRRNQISDQLGNLADQVGEWTENMRSSASEADLEMADGGSGAAMNRGTQGGSRGKSPNSGMNATGGSNSPSSAQSGGTGTNAS